MKALKRLSGAIILASFGTSSMADVSFSRTIDVSAGGALQGYNSEVTVRTQISGEKARSETLVQSVFGDDMGAENASILRLDKGVIWNLDSKNKRVEEKSLSQMREELSSLQSDLQDATAGAAVPFSPENCRWSEGDIDARKTSDKERIAGIRATRHILSLSQSCVDQSTGQSCDMEWLMEPWMSTKVPDQEEVQTFYENLADQLRMDYLIPQMSGASQILLAMFPNRWETLLDELENFEGYPLRTTMTMRLSGGACVGGAAAMAAAAGEGGMVSDAADAAYNASVNSAGSEAGSAVGSAAGTAMGDGVGATIGSSAVGAATSEIVGGLTGMFRKKKQSKPAPAAPAAPKEVSVFSIRAEVTNWENDTVPVEVFEVPAGWSSDQ